MNHDEFVRTVQAQSDLSDEARVSAAAESVLAVLSERLNHGQCEELAEALPDNLADAVTQADGDAEEFDADEFVQRVRRREDEREELDGNDAPTHIRSVLMSLMESTDDRWDDALAQLPEDYRRLYEG
ncbi:Uncharacterized conserved protein, DUF2267 family [Halogranum amylolyticum]|uniref:Uncharacterized conserved protein, DUF2267 family n=1 Tax=Halogranum amylolyticum TaxID=660520 RepID=A0A1H8PNI5_9EURY|nr:DUF2267 domain-containing protein [Halogranum amylolyticum]SEO43244.1 Uncharacterized conserved protein, DUF2267 family [Halogranum amylolyticum]